MSKAVQAVPFETIKHLALPCSMILPFTYCGELPDEKVLGQIQMLMGMIAESKIKLTRTMVLIQNEVVRFIATIDRKSATVLKIHKVLIPLPPGDDAIVIQDWDDRDHNEAVIYRHSCEQGTTAKRELAVSGGITGKPSDDPTSTNS